MLEGRSYVPILHQRPAEVRAYRELDSSTKNQILPFFVLRPWMNSRTIEKAIEVLSEAVGNRAFALDLDAGKFDPTSERPAYREFSELFEEGEGFRRYFDFVSDIENALPVIRSRHGEFMHIDEQIEWLHDLARPTFVRVDVDRPANYLDLAARIVDFGSQNACFIFDCGWSRSIQEKSARCTGLVNSLLGIDSEFNVVVAGSSFPEQFANLGERFDFPINERVLFAEVRRAVNRGHLFYGDWGSTRPPSPPVPMRFVPRLDFAESALWRCWRSEDGEDYVDVAKRITEDEAWDGNIGNWAEYMIEATAAGEEARIRAPAMASAVRINSHLHRQANLENPDGFRVNDEPVGDDI